MSRNKEICHVCHDFIKLEESRVGLVCNDISDLHTFHYKCYITVIECDKRLNYNKCPTCNFNQEVPFFSFEKDVKVKKKKNKCSICLEKLGMNINVKKTRCKHEFHKACINRWLETSNTCPLCRHKLRERVNPITPRPSLLRPTIFSEESRTLLDNINNTMTSLTNALNDDTARVSNIARNVESYRSLTDTETREEEEEVNNLPYIFENLPDPTIEEIEEPVDLFADLGNFSSETDVEIDEEIEMIEIIEPDEEGEEPLLEEIEHEE